MSVLEWSDSTCFREYVLDHLAAGVPLVVVAEDVSAFLNRTVPVEEVSAAVSDNEVAVRRAALLEEVRDAAPSVANEMLVVLRETKSFLAKAKEYFDSEDNIKMRDFETYRKALETKLKAVQLLSQQLKELKDSQARDVQNVNFFFNFDKLRTLENSGAIKINDSELAKELVGEFSEESAEDVA